MFLIPRSFKMKRVAFIAVAALALWASVQFAGANPWLPEECQGCGYPDAHEHPWCDTLPSGCEGATH